MAIELKINDKKQNAFDFEMDGKLLSTMIEKILAVSGFINSSGTMRRHMFVSYQKAVYLVGYSTDTFIAIKTKAKTRRDGAFNFDADKLKGLVKAKGKLNFEFTGNEFRISGGTYKVMIKPTPISIDQVPQVNDFFGQAAKKSEALGSDILAKLKNGISQTQIYDHFNENAPSPITVLLQPDSKKRLILKVMTQTHWAGALYEAVVKEKHKPFKMVLSSQVFNLISKVAGEDSAGAEFYFQEEGFKVQTEDTVIGLPPLQETETNKIEAFDDLLAGIKSSKKLAEFDFNVRPAIETMQSIMVLAVKNDFQMMLTGKNSSCSFSIDNDEGKVSDSIELESKTKAFKVPCFPRVIQDAMSNVKSGSAKMGIYLNDDGVPNIGTIYSSPAAGVRLRQFVGILSSN